jgi:hypothetical protein
MDTDRYYHDHLDRVDERPSPLPDVTEAVMFLFLAITIQMGHDLRDRLKDYWATLQYLPVWKALLLYQGFDIKRILQVMLANKRTYDATAVDAEVDIEV